MKNTVPRMFSKYITLALCALVFPGTAMAKQQPKQIRLAAEVTQLIENKTAEEPFYSKFKNQAVAQIQQLSSNNEELQTKDEKTEVSPQIFAGALYENIYNCMMVKVMDGLKLVKAVAKSVGNVFQKVSRMRCDMQLCTKPSCYAKVLAEIAGAISAVPVAVAAQIEEAEKIVGTLLDDIEVCVNKK